MPYPYTPYHLGPSLLIGLLLRKRLDLPVLVLANFAIDLVTLIALTLSPGGFIRTHGHTLLIGALVGLLWGVLAHFSLSGLFAKVLGSINLSYRSGITTKILSGVLGVWVHILVDHMYKPNVKLFWPLGRPAPPFPLERTAVSVSLISSFIVASLLFAVIVDRAKKSGGLGR